MTRSIHRVVSRDESVVLRAVLIRIFIGNILCSSIISSVLYSCSSFLSFLRASVVVEVP